MGLVVLYQFQRFGTGFRFATYYEIRPDIGKDDSKYLTRDSSLSAMIALISLMEYLSVNQPAIKHRTAEKAGIIASRIDHRGSSGSQPSTVPRIKENRVRQLASREISRSPFTKGNKGDFAANSADNRATIIALAKSFSD